MEPVEYLPPKAVVEKTSLSRTTLWRLVRSKKFPAPRQLSPGRVGFRADLVAEWLEMRPEAA